MSRGYSKGGGFTIIIAILGTVIVVVIGIFLFARFSSTPLFGGSSTEAVVTGIPTKSVTPTPTVDPADATAVVVVPTLDANANDATQAPDVAATPAPTIQAKIHQSCTIGRKALNVRSQPDLNSEKLGTVKYKQTFEVLDDTGKWLKIRFNNGYGWVWADYCSRGNDPVLTLPPADANYLVSSMSATTNTADSLIVEVKFSIGVYGDSGKGSAVNADDFTITGAAWAGTKISGNSLDTQKVVLTLDPDSASVTVSVKSSSIFNGAGTADDGYKKTFTVGSNPTATATPEPASGSGAVTESNLTISNATFLSISHSEGNQTATVTVAYASGSEGNVILIVGNAYASDGDSIQGTGDYTVAGDNTTSGTQDITVTFSEGAYGGTS